MRIHLADILCVKIAWLRVSKRFVPRTDAYKMAATTVSYGWCRLSVGAGNTTICIIDLDVVLLVFLLGEGLYPGDMW